MEVCQCPPLYHPWMDRQTDRVQCVTWPSREEWSHNKLRQLEAFVFCHLLGLLFHNMDSIDVVTADTEWAVWSLLGGYAASVNTSRPHIEDEFVWHSHSASAVVRVFTSVTWLITAPRYDVVRIGGTCRPDSSMLGKLHVIANNVLSSVFTGGSMLQTYKL